MHPIDALNKVARIISSSKCRNICGNPQDQAWSRYRRSAGIDGRKKLLTAYEAVMLLVRRDWRQICKELEWKYISDPTPSTLYRAAVALVDEGKQDQLFKRIRTLAAITSADDKTWQEVMDLIEHALGKPITERTVRRICTKNSKLPRFSRNKQYSNAEVQQIVQEVIQHYQIRQQPQNLRSYWPSFH